MDDPKSAIERLKDLGWEAYSGGLNLKGASLFRKARELAEAEKDERQRVHCLFSEGECLYQAGENDTATRLFLEAAYCRSSEADPAAVYNAAIKLIELSQKQKDAAYCQKLILQTRGYLKGINKQAWQNKLDLLEGELEFMRGKLKEALPLFVEAWEGYQKNPGYPSFTTASYLIDLCGTAFYLRDMDNLVAWVEAIEACEKKLELDKVSAKIGRLYLFRAKRTLGKDFWPASDIALSALGTLSLVEGKGIGIGTLESTIECLRILAISSRWEDLDYWMAKFRVDESFGYLLFRGDERLCRARQALCLPVQDDEYEDFKLPEKNHKSDGCDKAEENRLSLSSIIARFFPVGKKTANPEAATQSALTIDKDKGRQFLNEAQGFFEKARIKAKSEDERLDTDWFTRRIDDRMARVNGIKEYFGLFD